MDIRNNNKGIQTVGLVIGVVIVLIVAAAAVYTFSQSDTDTTNTNDAAMTEEKKDDAMVEDDGVSNTNSNTNTEVIEDTNTNTAVMEDKEGDTMEDGTVANTNTNSQPAAAVDGQYTDYTEATFASTASQERVLFFHAGWCPSCRTANTEINNNLDQIPDNVVILKTDYDSEKELTQKYGVTYQHTFVHVDADGNIIKKWNGGGIDEIVKNVS